MAALAQAPLAGAPVSAPPVAGGAAVSFAAALASQALTYLLELEIANGVATTAPAGVGAVPLGAAPVAAPDATFQAASTGTSVMRFADRTFITGLADDPAATWYEPRLAQPLRLSRGVQLAPTVPADGSQTALAELANGDGNLDNAVSAAAIDGRRMQVLAGLQTDPLSAFVPVWTGVARAWQQDDDTVRIEGYDASYLLDGPVQPTLYAGTGTYEGTSDLAGTPKPLALGQVWNVEPVLVDPANLVYQVHDGPVQSIAVYEGGLVVASGGDTSDLYAGSTSAGQVRTDLARGLFQLGSSPTQRITADVEGDAPAGLGYASGIGTLVYRLLRLRAGIAERYLDAGSFDSLDAAGIGVSGVYLDVAEDVRAALTRLLAGVGAFWTCRRDGRIRALRLADPNATAIVRRFDPVSILSLRTLRLPDAVFPPVWRTVVGWRRNHTVQTGEDLSGSITDARRQELGRPWSTAADSDGTVRNRHLNARELGQVDSPLQVEADALALADWLLDLHARDRQLLEVVVPAIGQTIEMGDTVLLTWPRLGLSAGKAYRAFPVEEDCDRRTVTLACWG